MAESLTGMDRDTGAELSGVEHLRQSVADILTTPIGSRVLRRDYGSGLYDLIDRPFNDETRVLMVSEVAQALNRWEPRLRSVRVEISAETQHHGTIALTVVGYYRHNGEEVLLEGIII